MGFWILGHGCRHHAFSEYQWVDDVVGFFIHSVCLTPYFSFKYSHRSHHAHTNSIEYDQVYIPTSNGPGNVRDYNGFANHFIPQSGICNDHDRGYVVLSDIGIATALYVFVPACPDTRLKIDDFSTWSSVVCDEWVLHHLDLPKPHLSGNRSL
ncbi:hypothetical protein OSB04_022307 [Centaurea solstitialis]|uniref:Fatty acid desaturase domain-containing protein n=1 Tax=Centaurea solstitialis TaxID=347529 RepID=A0AA38SVW6_9ASTR|nr:hypothetical protein OSB04_022307 [Centaurea solstitialis]